MVGRAPAVPRLLDALRRLEYRGYDSAGVAVATTAGLNTTVHSVARVDGLSIALVEAGALQPDLARAGAGIGHTRWATHGAAIESNAHPLNDCTGRISVAHNGIIENASALRLSLIGHGHTFTSQVDSEVIAHLIEDSLKSQTSLHTALEMAVASLVGTWAIVVLDASSGNIAVASHGSPLVVARGSGAAFVASDVNAISAWVESFRVLENDDSVEITGLTDHWHRAGLSILAPVSHPVRWGLGPLAEGQVGDRMGFEIEEQPEVASRVLDSYAEGIASGELWKQQGLAPFERVVMLGCGTSLNAGAAIAAILTRCGRIPTLALVASESSDAVIESGTLVCAMSQSGETADVLHALDSLADSPHTLLSLTNSPHSTLARRSAASIDCLAGIEVGVAATKTFVAQVLTGSCLALSALVAMGRLSSDNVRPLVEDLLRTPERLETAIALARDRVPSLVTELREESGYLFLGRGPGLVYAAEGALKLKELSYRWAESYPAGELKHGPLALVSRGTPVFVVDSGNPRLAVNVAEVSARGARVVRLGDSHSHLPVILAEDDANALLNVPWGPLPAVVALQMFARGLALELGLDVDKPRNLAKSVTVD